MKTRRLQKSEAARRKATKKSTLTILLRFADRLETTKRRGEDWEQTGCSHAQHQVQSFSMAPWERPEFASVQSKVPFAWHFLDNRSLINHWPWIRIFKGTTEAKTTGARVGACVRGWCASSLRTVHAGAPDRLFQNWLIYLSPGTWAMLTRVDVSWTEARSSFGRVPGSGCYWRRCNEIHQCACTVTTTVATPGKDAFVIR